MAGDAGPGAAEAVAWLEGQLRSERQHMQVRHDSMVWGLEQVLRQHADTDPDAGLHERGPISAQPCTSRSKNPMRATGELLEVAMRVHGSRPEHVMNDSARVPDAEVVNDWLVKPMSMDESRDAHDSEARNGNIRSSKELTDDALHNRGFDLAVERSDGPPTYGKARAAGGTPCGIWIRLVWALARYYSECIVEHRMFDYCIGVVIVLNSVCIGLEIDTTVDGSLPATELVVLERLFLIAYVVELTMRVLGAWKTCWNNAWIQLDLFLVFLGIILIWVLEPLMKNGDHGDAVSDMNKVLLIRVLRLFRLARAMRFVRLMQPLWKLISGLWASLHTVVSAVFLLFGSIYVFACVGVSVFAQDQTLNNDTVTGPIIEEYFQSVPVLMLTLIQFTSCDSVAAIYSPLIQVKPIMLMYFVPIIIVLPISIMNLITAVIVDQAVQASAHDAEMERCRLRGRLKELIPLLNSIFSDFDLSNDGKINLAELDLTRVSRTLPSEVLDVLKSHKLLEFFNVLDADASGQIDQNEWVDGMCCLVMNEVPIENLQMFHLLSRQASDLEALRRALLPGDGQGQPAAAGARA